MRVLRSDRSGGLPQRTDIVQHPERTAVRRHDKIVVVNDHVVDRRVRQIELQRVPIPAVVERNPDPRFRSRVEQAFALGVFAHCVNIGIVGQAGDNFRPGFAEVRGFENVRFEVV